MARLYHPDLAGDHAEYECPDDEGLLAVLAESGWKPAPEPEQRPGYEPEPVKYAPVTSVKVRPAASATRAEWDEYVSQLGGNPEGLTKAELQAKADELEGDQPD